MLVRRSTVLVVPFLLSALLAADAQASPSTASATSADAATRPAAVARHADVAAAWLDDVSAIAVAADATARRDAVRARAQVRGLALTETSFDAGEHGQGINLLADVAGPADAPLLLLGAHYDAVDVGMGATDNASGTALVFELAQRLQARPLQHHRVAIALWDLEERGLLGAKAHVRTAQAPALYVNFDVFGWGDTLWMMSPAADGPLVAASRQAALDHAVGFESGDSYPPTDHRAFLQAQLPAVSYSLMDADEIPPLLAMLGGDRRTSPPRVMRVIHSPEDDVSQLDAQAVARAMDVIEQALRSWDADAAPLLH